MVSRGRRGKDSRCCDPREVPLGWRDFQDDTHEQIVEYEYRLTRMRDTVREIELGEIDDLFDAAAMGELEDSGDNYTPIKPITREPEVYELRWLSRGAYLRFYHGEPGELPDELVKLHRQIKTSKESQDLAIGQAQLRYRAGRRSLWQT